MKKSKAVLKVLMDEYDVSEVLRYADQLDQEAHIIMTYNNGPIAVSDEYIEKNIEAFSAVDETLSNLALEKEHEANLLRDFVKGNFQLKD